MTETSGKLILKDPQGNPLAVVGELTDSSGNAQPAQKASSFAFSVPSAGSIRLSVKAPEDTRIGWAILEDAGNSLGGIATHEYVNGAKTESLFSVPQSQPIQLAVIPVDMDRGLGKELAYAVTNPGSRAVSIKIMLVAKDGAVAGDSININLGPGEQTSRYLTWNLTSSKFSGSLVIRSQSDQSFVLLALLAKQGLFAPIPLVRFE